MNDKLKIVQINVRSWNQNKNSIVNMINEIDADVALLNEHGCKNNQIIKIHNYTVTQKNTLNEKNNGCAIAIKRSIKCKINNEYESDLISAEITTTLGPIELATAYVPPRTGHIHYPDFYKLFNQNKEVHFVGDLNGRSAELGYRNTNTVGTQIQTLIDRGHANHDGPHFATFIDNRAQTTPDIILTNSNMAHNTHAQRGPPVTSDHIPIIYHINSAPIQIPIKKRPCYKRANWEGYREQMGDSQPATTLHDKSALDNELRKWTEEIQEASKHNIPTTQYRTIPGVKSTEKLKKLKMLLLRTHNLITLRGPTRSRYGLLTRCRNLIKGEFRKERGRNWDWLMERMDGGRMEEFWVNIKRIYGRKETRDTSYLKDHNNKDVHENLEKETLFREHW